jgi:hypothetical protein
VIIKHISQKGATDEARAPKRLARPIYGHDKTPTPTGEQQGSTTIEILTFGGEYGEKHIESIPTKPGAPGQVHAPHHTLRSSTRRPRQWRDDGDRSPSSFGFKKIVTFRLVSIFTHLSPSEASSKSQYVLDGYGEPMSKSGSSKVPQFGETVIEIRPSPPDLTKWQHRSESATLNSQYRALEHRLQSHSIRTRICPCLAKLCDHEG